MSTFYSGERIRLLSEFVKLTDATNLCVCNLLNSVWLPTNE